MPLTVRLDADTEQKLALTAKEQGLSKSEFVRRCLVEYLDQQTGDGRSAWELGKDVFGKRGSGRPDLASNAKQVVREKIHAKQEHRGRGAARRTV